MSNVGPFRESSYAESRWPILEKQPLRLPSPYRLDAIGNGWKWLAIRFSKPCTEPGCPRGASIYLWTLQMPEGC